MVEMTIPGMAMTPQLPSFQTDVRYTAEQAAAYLGLTVQCLADWRSSGKYKLPFLKLGRFVRYRKSDLDKWLESRVVNSGETTKG